MRRGAGRGASLSKRQVLYVLFIGLNVCWFVWTLLFVGGKEPDPAGQAPPQQQPLSSSNTEEFPFGEPLSVRRARAQVTSSCRYRPCTLAPTASRPRVACRASTLPSWVGRLASVAAGHALIHLSRADAGEGRPHVTYDGAVAPTTACLRPSAPHCYVCGFSVSALVWLHV